MLLFSQYNNMHIAASQAKVTQETALYQSHISMLEAKLARKIDKLQRERQETTEVGYVVL